MGYQETVLGLTEENKNHGSDSFIIRLICKKMFSCSEDDNDVITEIKEITEKDLNNVTMIKCYLYDDLITQDGKSYITCGVEEGSCLWDECGYFEINYKHNHKIKIGQHCCFNGIIFKSIGYCDTQIIEEYEMTELFNWRRELTKTNRLSETSKLIIISNCCS
jgi:hypothetical protein